MSTLANLTEVLFRLDFDPDTAVYHYRGQTLSRLQCRTYILPGQPTGPPARPAIAWCWR